MPPSMRPAAVGAAAALGVCEVEVLPAGVVEDALPANDALKPLVLVQAEPIVVLAPEMKFTGAH